MIKQRGRRGAYMIVLASMIVAVLLLQLLPYFTEMSQIYTRFISLSHFAQEPHWQMRVDNWQTDILPSIILNPLGYGTGSAADNLNYAFAGRYTFTSHSTYLKIALELGVLGLLLFLAISWKIIRIGLSTLSKIQDNFLKGTMISILSFFVAFLIAGIVGPFTDTYPTNLYMWFLVGVLSRIKDIDNNQLNLATVTLHQN
jgi:O-antigen ligase